MFVTPPSRDRLEFEGKAMAEQNVPDALLTPAEVAALFRVNPKTVTRWARAGKITAIRTLGGHRRFRASEIKRCLEQMEREGA
jgi:excisionase family DNA binding protein